MWEHSWFSLQPFGKECICIGQKCQVLIIALVQSCIPGLDSFLNLASGLCWVEITWHVQIPTELQSVWIPPNLIEVYCLWITYFRWRAYWTLFHFQDGLSCIDASGYQAYLNIKWVIVYDMEVVVLFLLENVCCNPAPWAQYFHVGTCCIHL